MKTTRLLPFATLCGLLLASAGAQAVTCQNNIPPSNPDSIYTNNNDGTVTDTRTGLMWKQCVEGLSGTDCATGSATSFNWAAALTHAESHEFAGHDDWRLPNIKELRSLVEECRTGPAINDTVFPATPSSNVWSGSPYAYNSNYAWHVNFNYGYAYYLSRSDYYHVRLVRGGQSFDPLPENGACGTAHGQATLLAPADNLCSAGTASSVSTAVVGAFTWSCDGANGGTTASCSAPRQYTVTPSAGANGAISPDSVQNVTYNLTQTFIVTPDAGYSATIAGTCPAGSWSGNAYTTGQIVDDCTVEASFSEIPPSTYTVEASTSPAAGGTAACTPASVTSGGTITCTATANAGYRFTGWSGDCAGTETSCTLTNITADRLAVAHFQAGLPLPEGPHAGQLLQVDAGSGAWQLDELSLHTTASLGAPPPAGVTVPHGVVSLRLSGGAAGSNATVVLTYPEALPAGTRYYKYGPTAANPAAHWYEYPHAVINGNTITLTLTDGGPGDSDGVANSSIVDPGGPALLAGDVAAIPSLSQWAAMLLAGLMGLFAFGRIRRLPRA
jgi:uncharacterized repeat protein (TIGR02543 family)